MQVVVDATAMPVQPWAALGIDMGAGDAVLPELSGATGFRFRVRGVGRWSIKLEEIRGESSVTWTSAFAVANAWTTTRVAAASLSSETGAPQTWSARPRKVRQIMFQATKAGNLDVAELAVEGTNLGDGSR